MLRELTVENVAIIERAQIGLEGGFTVLTGETGAGKSLLVDAIELALGGRADSDLVRAGASRGTVALVVDLSGLPELRVQCAAMGIELESGVLFLQREIGAEGRSSCRIAGRLAPVGTLRQIGTLLVDLHGQHAHQSLLDPRRHLEYLDAWIGEPARRLHDEVSAAYARANDLRWKIQTVRNGHREREQRLDLLKFQISEIEAVSPRLGEVDELEARLARLANLEKLGEWTHGALGALSSDEGAANEAIGESLKRLEAGAALDPTLGPAMESLRQAGIALDEAVRILGEYIGRLESDPGALQETADRLDALRRLRRKYGDDEEAVLDFLDKAQFELDAMETKAEDLEGMVELLGQAEEELDRTAGLLSNLRKDHAARFANAVAEELADLAMDRAALEVGFETKPAEADGIDRVEFLFSANAGEPVRPLSKIASGGEISRVMLAIKVVLAGKAGVPTLIFDEIDAGLGGRAAAAVAKKLEQIAAHYQVIVITHLPQIAGRAAIHYRIEKVDEDERTVTRVRRLEPDERVEEIARMLAGEVITPTAEANARELLARI
ncbi:MAG TPA: DNA repair protein RecN [Fimbriimonadaceae bacterium]|nr:DNA repair protein RecN [Fimbriimonadaceae bacterium]HRJ97108.1 DNA repair protein RecN [Fimbriimonadaceae bacterium]